MVISRLVLVLCLVALVMFLPLSAKYVSGKQIEQHPQVEIWRVIDRIDCGNLSIVSMERIGDVSGESLIIEVYINNKNLFSAQYNSNISLATVRQYRSGTWLYSKDVYDEDVIDMINLVIQENAGPSMDKLLVCMPNWGSVETTNDGEY